MGAHIKLIPSREDDFFGIAYGIYKGAVNNYRGYPAYLSDEDGESHGNRREQVLELMYSFQVNDYLKLVPHFQYIKNPAYRDVSSESICGVQAVFSF
jgi:carbohydrate-selective porin OprB